MMDDMCDMPEFCNVIEVKKSRKEHLCCECGDKIPVGSSYVYISGKWSGDISSYYQHQECAEACRSVRDDFGEGCIAFGYYTEWLSEYFYARSGWSERMRSALVDLILKHPKIKEQIKDYVTSYDDWCLQKIKKRG